MDASGTWLFPRINGSYQDLSGVLSKLSDKCERLIAYEHAADEEVATTHIHFLMLNPHIDVEGYKKICKKMGHQRDRHGWKWESGKTWPSWDGAIVYMTKGRLRPVFLKGFTQEEAETARLKWRDITPSGKTEKRSALVNAFLESHSPELDVTIDSTRRWVFHYLWNHDRVAPNPTHYKQMSATCYLAWAETARQRDFSCAVNEIINLWY